MLKRIIVLIATAALGLVMFAPKAEAAYPIYIKNHAYSVANLSVSTTNPASSGNIYSIAPGRAATGLCFYASASKLTQYWLGSGSVKTAPAGKWTCPPYSSLQYTVRIFN